MNAFKDAGKLQDLTNLSASVVRWLAENADPHTQVVITQRGFEVYQELIGVPVPFERVIKRSDANLVNSIMESLNEHFMAFISEDRFYSDSEKQVCNKAELLLASFFQGGVLPGLEEALEVLGEFRRKFCAVSFSPHQMRIWNEGTRLIRAAAGLKEGVSG